jgi:hypothetical protein
VSLVSYRWLNSRGVEQWLQCRLPKSISSFGDNILRGNVPLTKPQKEKLARNKAGLRALTKKSVSGPVIVVDIQISSERLVV